jgi:hypothetical protein
MNDQPNQVRGATAFCIPGEHPVDVATEWGTVRASLNEQGQWVRDENSPATIAVCVKHLPVGRAS